MNKLTNTIIVAVFGVGCFVGGTYYATEQFNEKIDKWDRNFSVIQKEVSAFIDVSNPKTIRLYTTELRKILDDVTLLNKIVESGQISSEALDGYFSEYDEKLESIRQTLNNDELIAVLDNLQESLDSQDIRDDKLSEDIKSLQDRLKRQYDYTSELNTNLQQSIKKVQEDIDVVKKSKYGGKIWQK